jgi:hypothetical protein
MSDTDLVIDLMKQWVVLADHTKAGPIKPKTSFKGPASRNYQLKNKQLRKFLQWEDQIGMNIGWTDDAEPATAKKVQRWFFMRDGENDTPVRYGEWLALGNGNAPSFAHYESRTVGVNLQWHDAPAFQWKLLGGKKGTPVKTGEYLAIYNGKAKEPFIYMDRTVGGDVGWPSSKTWGEQFQDKLGDLAGKALDRAIDGAITALLA